jgi:uncharacterized membrane protein YhdT
VNNLLAKRRTFRTILFLHLFLSQAIIVNLWGTLMDKRFIQAHREARWALGLTLLYLLAWGLAAYLPDSAIGVTGLPHWFEMACLLVPLLFIGLCWLMVRTVFRDISLEDRDAN